MGTSFRTSRSLAHRCDLRPRMAPLLVLVSLLAPLCTCNPCSSSSFLFSLAPVPSSCRRYSLCFRGRILRQLPCPRGTAFDPSRLVCTARLHPSCLVRESQNKVQSQLSCPGETTVTYYPDYSKSCPSSRYFLCRNGVLSRQTCAKGQVFDEGTDTCASPSSFLCGVTGPGCSRQSRDSALYANYTLGCPALGFAMCLAGGVSVGLSCPEGLFYNGAAKNCDYPDNIVCGDNVPHFARITQKYVPSSATYR